MIYHELETMQVKKRTGKVEHADGAHDDQVFSYLMALYVLFRGSNLMENWGIQRTTIKTDEDKEIEESLIESDEAMEQIDPEIFKTEDDEPMTPEEKINKAFYESNKNIKSETQFMAEMKAAEDAEFNVLLSTDRGVQEAFKKKYNVLPAAMVNFGGVTTIPDSVFMDLNMDDQDAQREAIRKRNGNLYEIFSGL